MWQQILIGLVVAIAAIYVGWTLIGSRLRLRLVELMLRRKVATAWASRQRAKLAAGGCSNCSVPKRPALHR